MNNCELYQELISRLVDGEVSRNEYAALEAHMKNCAECSAMYAVFASLSDIIGGEDEPLPEDLHENIMAGVRRSAMINHNRRRLSKPVRNALAAAACAALVLFASRGLAPEKAADVMLNETQTAAMDMQREENAAPAAQPAAVEPAPVQSEATTVTPAATAKPVATPRPTQDIYLNSEEEEAKPASGNTNNNTNTVTVTPKPVEIVVDTPVTVASPKPTEAPSQIVTITASPMPVAPVQPTDVPKVVAEAAAQPEAASAEPAAEEEAPESVQPMTVAEAAPVAESEAASAAEDEQPEPAATETPSLTKRFFSFFGMARPEAVTEPAAEEPAAVADEAPAEELAEPEAVSEEEVTPAAEADEDEEENLIKLANLEKLTELENMLDGEEAQLPEGESDEEYRFVLAEPEEGLEEYEIRVCIYGDTIYYVQIFSEEDSINCLAPCKLEDFEKFMDSLSDEEKGIKPEASPEPSAQPESEKAAEETPGTEVPDQTEQSPVPTEAAAKQ